ncbi:MAG TPA: nitrilase-related carbon-nitrogen hydrolase [Saprospiraceae bacterium]|jgi:predicted amidohydrolase|nr:nitrilase-related carbon-nitrogen hydrolase [Saprospiraceae bacterium]
MSNLSICIVQSELVWENRSENLKHFAGLFERDLKEHVDVIILPEMFTTGFTMNVVSNYDVMDGETVNWMKQISVQYKTAICGSVIICEEGSYFNRFIWVYEPDHQIQYYDKKHLFCLAKEDRYFKSGNKNILIQYKDWNISPFICYDLRFPEWMRNTNLADLQIVVANFPKKRELAWKSLLPARAIENQCYIAATNIIGNDGNGIEYNGQSAVYSFEGETLISCLDRSTIQLVSLDKHSLSVYRRAYPFLKDSDNFKELLFKE